VPLSTRGYRWTNGASRGVFPEISPFIEPGRIRLRLDGDERRSYNFQRSKFNPKLPSSPLAPGWLPAPLNPLNSNNRIERHNRPGISLTRKRPLKTLDEHSIEKRDTISM